MNSVYLYQCNQCDAHEHADASQSCQHRKFGQLIDMHCHVFLPEAMQLVADRPEFAAEQAGFLADMGAASVAHNQQVMLPGVKEKLVDVSARLADMDAAGVAIQCLSPAPAQYHYWADAELASELVSLQNRAISQLCQDHPSRFVGLGAVALQHPELAIGQLRELMQLPGMKGVEIGTRIQQQELAAPELAGFWQAAAELGALVFIHPFSSRMDERLVPWYLSNLIGQPLETTVALSHLIFSGTLQRLPELKILAAHGGGYLPQYVGRLDQGARVRPESAGLNRAPSEFLRQIWFDSLVFSPLTLRHLIEQVGIGQVVLGTDYPFDMGSPACQSWLSELNDTERQALLRDNAARLLGLDLPANETNVPSSVLTPSRTGLSAGEEKECL